MVLLYDVRQHIESLPDFQSLGLNSRWELQPGLSDTSKLRKDHIEWAKSTQTFTESRLWQAAPDASKNNGDARPVPSRDIAIMEMSGHKYLRTNILERSIEFGPNLTMTFMETSLSRKTSYSGWSLDRVQRAIEMQSIHPLYAKIQWTRTATKSQAS